MIHFVKRTSFIYDHRTLKTRLPVRSALFKQCTGGLVVRWVTTSEYPLLYVFAFLQFQLLLNRSFRIPLPNPPLPSDFTATCRTLMPNLDVSSCQKVHSGRHRHRAQLEPPDPTVLFLPQLIVPLHFPSRCICTD
ncbi:hypothetical protein BU25DRAFT_467015 [Macroventuria anomochaeta]|uniref:Uncharacterized protein n=1 Tax=Macroventuria anomochaeta TaxID=301207 RepID=A0ACB6S2P8_9PLEO|nr:uncharacterized protein BU25DRAFT_467015 [Macroventuria anomochaeta]KAF2628426.1 hypothetical protein BU25DRAFT_467015 [Macroventuria anomochaeta]